MIRHFLAYGNSDQASFRDEVVRTCFDYMTVPGTIASYYADATAAFVLSAEIPYMIDPRTPLFQETVDSPRASHYSLAEWLDIQLEEVVVESGGRDVARLPVDFYTEERVVRMVDRLLQVQFDYGQRSTSIQAKLDRYRRLLAEALGQDVPAESNEIRPPEFVLSPYFMSSNAADPWWEVNRRIWQRCEAHARRGAISPVVAVTDVGFLTEAMTGPPDQLSGYRFFWINGFEERRVTQQQLLLCAEAMKSHNGDEKWINLYGGFFSIALGSVGLWGFNNGLGYSEARSWPQLGATGAAPQRYYIPRLHTFASVASSQLLFETEPWFFEPVSVQRVDDPSIATMSYHALKKDFALARRWEIRDSSERTAAETAEMLDEARQRYSAVEGSIPARLRLDTSYLGRWGSVLRAV